MDTYLDECVSFDPVRFRVFCAEEYPASIGIDLSEDFRVVAQGREFIRPLVCYQFLLNSLPPLPSWFSWQDEGFQLNSISLRLARSFMGGLPNDIEVGLTVMPSDRWAEFPVPELELTSLGRSTFQQGVGASVCQLAFGDGLQWIPSGGLAAIIQPVFLHTRSDGVAHCYLTIPWLICHFHLPVDQIYQTFCSVHLNWSYFWSQHVGPRDCYGYFFQIFARLVSKVSFSVMIQLQRLPLAF